MLKNLIWLLLILLIAGFVSACGKTSAAPAEAEPEHVIPMTSATPTPAPPKTYIYNPMEYSIAMSQDLGFLQQELKRAGYNLTEREITDFQKKHGLQPGDRVTVRGKLIKARGNIGDLSKGVEFERGVVCGIALGKPTPAWLGEMQQYFGKDVLVTLQGTAVRKIIITDCQPAESTK